jgi:hypothetical protein
VWQFLNSRPDCHKLEKKTRIAARSIRLRLLHEHTTTSFEGKHQIGDVESLPLSEMWREGAHETKPMMRRAEMRRLSRRLLNRRTVAGLIEVIAVKYESGAAIGQCEIVDDQVSACLRRKTLAVRLRTMRCEKQALLRQRSIPASGGATRMRSHRVLIMIGYLPIYAFAIWEFVAA